LNGLLSERRGNLDIFILFCNLNLLIAFQTILQNEERSRQGEVEDVGREDLEFEGRDESSDGGHEDSD
jgi:hypothetical protein